MPVVSFFKAEKSLTIKEIELLSSAKYSGDQSDMCFGAVSAVSTARAGDITFATGVKQKEDLASLTGVLVFCTPNLTAFVPPTCVILECGNPSLAFNRVARALYAPSIRSPEFSGLVKTVENTFVHPSAKLESGVILSPGCVIGEGVEIGGGSRIGPNVVIAAHCTIGRDCDLGANASIQCAMIGDKVIIGPGANIGHDGFGFVPGPAGMEKVPQLGRVIIQSHVEIGANSCIDRGSLSDTVIGEGTKIDNMVQIAHNVQIGRHCAIAAHVGISGSVTIGDGVMLGGRAGIADHVTIGSGAIILAASGLMTDVPAGARYGGAPAQPAKEWFRGLAILRKLSARGKNLAD